MDKPKCYNCKFASSGFKIAGKTHHQCCHPKHKEGFESGKLSPWDTLQEFYNTCESHEFKTKCIKHEPYRIGNTLLCKNCSDRIE